MNSVQHKTCCDFPRPFVIKESDKHHFCRNCRAHDFRGFFANETQWEMWLDNPISLEEAGATVIDLVSDAAV
jgi:hypothetical protein